MKKHKGIPIIYDYWVDEYTDILHAIVKWTDEKIEGNKSNLFLISKEHYDNNKKF